MISTYLRFHTFTLAIWFVIMVFYAFIVGALYESIGAQAGLAEAYENLPEALKRSIGFEEGSFVEGIITAEGYVAAELYSWWPVILAIYAVIYGAGAIAGEVERATADLVLVQPVPRSRFLLSKFVVFLVGLSAIAAATVIGVEAGLLVTGIDVSFSGLVLTQIQAWSLVVAFGAYTFAFSALTLSYRATLAWAGGLTVLLYVWELVTATVDALEPLAPLTLFHYYDAFDGLTHQTLSYSGLAVAGGVAVAGLIVALVAFQRRDLST